jgi:3-deoxy-manno-octulosonate cytidylyltransferase (CMP-KDO synthetase)
MNKPFTLGIIPARFESTRFPGKPLALINGISMIERVYKQCQKAETLNKLCVATDDNRIFEHVTRFGGNVVLTSANHLSGTDRCLEALLILTEKQPGLLPEVVINIQGDEPLINPETIDMLTAAFYHPETDIATVSAPFGSMTAVTNSNTVKIVMDLNGKALYFSRSPIPFFRNELPDAISFHKHIGIYAFRTEVLKTICALPPSKLEQTESLEQLRWLENGFRIQVTETKDEGLCVDVPEDIKVIEEYINKHSLI